MVGLIDIAATVETVPVNGRKVEVHGISIEGLVQLLGRFPELREILGGAVPSEAKAGALIKRLGPDLAAAVLAAGTGAPGDEAAETVARSLGLGVQAALLKAILRQTLPEGIGPFVALLRELTDGLEAEMPALAAAGRGTPGKAPASKSRRRSKR